MHLTFHFVPLSDPSPLISYPEFTTALWTNVHPWNPPILPAAVLYSLKDDSYSSGRASPASTYTHLAVHLPSSIGHSLESRRALFLWHVGWVCWGAAVPILSSGLYLEFSKCLWLSAALVSMGLDQSLICTNKGHFIDWLLISCLLYCDSTKYFW